MTVLNTNVVNSPSVANALTKPVTQQATMPSLTKSNATWKEIKQMFWLTAATSTRSQSYRDFKQTPRGRTTFATKAPSFDDTRGGCLGAPSLAGGGSRNLEQGPHTQPHPTPTRELYRSCNEFVVQPPLLYHPSIQPLLTDRHVESPAMHCEFLYRVDDVSGYV